MEIHFFIFQTSIFQTSYCLIDLKTNVTATRPRLGGLAWGQLGGALSPCRGGG